jgi:tetratricopeptide (TPR) repeat protein
MIDSRPRPDRANSHAVKPDPPAPAGAARAKPPWLQVRELFEQLAELPPPLRSARLQAVPLEATIARELRELLAQHDAEESAGGAFLGQPLRLVEPRPRADALPEAGEGLRLGPWRLTMLLGSGGMGQVWEAERDDGAFDARVAVKLLPADRAGGQALLQREQRALARLSHPNIARLLDAGIGRDGRPYVVMEAVDGRPLDAACRGLPLAQRLALFLQLADAVSHAHRQGLVHRDLKPANVLVTAEGQVKLLDFGIAQALQGAPEDPGAVRALTPGYASPEQVRGEAVGPASDVYALGVLLHRLLTGTRPYADPQAPGSAPAAAPSVAQALRAVLETVPTPPSQTPVPLHDDADPGVPRPALRGDLDAIVARALAKPVRERYASVDALAADLRAALAHRPVSARPHTPAYLLRCVVQRHRGTVAAALLALLAVAGALGTTAWQTGEAIAALALAAMATGLAASTWQARAASQARDEAQQRLAQTSVLVREVLMRYADMATFLPGGLRMKADLLNDTIAHLARLRVSAPADAELAGELAKAHARLADMQLPGLDTTLDQPEEARANADRALALFPEGEPAHRDDPAYAMWWARALRVQQKMQRLAGEVEASMALSERLRRFLQAALRRHPADFALRFELGSVLLSIGQANDTWHEPSLNRAQQALAALTEAEAVFAELARDRPGDSDVRFQLGTVAGAQAIVLMKQGRSNEAIAAGRRAVQWREQALALRPDHTSYRGGVAGEGNNLAMNLLSLGTPEADAEAEAVTARGEALMRALEAQDPDLPTWSARRRWFAMHRGRALLAVGRAAEAVPVLTEALQEMACAGNGPTVGRRGWCALELAHAEAAQGRPDAAARHAAQAVADLQQRLAEAPDDADAAARLQAAQALAGPPPDLSLPRAAGAP